MAQSVEKLKELLFDSESRALETLTQRVHNVESLTLDDRRQREGIAQRVDAVYNRAGTSERFEESIAEVLDGALRRAEVDRHAELASAIAPLVVRTVKTEIRNSRDELVEALYPMTGRMVQAYVASAMKDLAKDINRRLEQNAIMLRLRSLAAGKSVAEIAMADSQRLVVEDLFLIRRGSGELVGRWPAAAEDSGNRDHVMSGVLTAINEFSSEALKDDGSTLRQIDLGERQLFLRVSPAFLLAAKCSGSAPEPVEAVLDQSFLETIERLQQLPDGGRQADASQSGGILQDLSQNLEQRLDDKTAEMASQAGGISPLRLLAWIIGLPLAAWLSWIVYADYKTEKARTIALRTLSSFSELTGYPMSLDVSRLGREVTVSGLAPAQEVKLKVVEGLEQALPGSLIKDRLSVLPNGLEAFEPRIAGVRRDVSALAPELARARDDIAAVDPKIDSMRDKLAGLENELQAASLARALDRTQLRLQEAQDVMAGLTSGAADAAVDGGTARRAVSGLEAAVKSLGKVRNETVNSATVLSPAGRGLMAAVATHIHEAEAGISAIAGFPARPGRSDTILQEKAALSALSESLSAQADRLASVTLAAAQVVAFKRSLPVAAGPSARERLVAFSRANAIFFTNDVDFRAPGQANAALNELAALMKGNDVLVRVVGYTDNQGTPESNTALSAARSETVMAALRERGVPANRLVKLGRVDSVGISPERGALSPNRRVEFEIGFAGEAAP